LAGDSNEGCGYSVPFTPLVPVKPPQLKPLGASNTGFRLQVIGDAGLKLEVQGTSDFKTAGSKPLSLASSVQQASLLLWKKSSPNAL
jgi:hypothetical protein